MEINKTIFDNFPVLKTKRLTMREIRLSDAKKIFEMRSNGRINQFINRDKMYNIDDSIKIAEKSIKGFQNRSSISWAGILRDDKTIIGSCGFNQIDYPNLRAELGGELSTEYWGKNIAYEAVNAIIEFGLNTMNLHTIEAKVSPENRGAIFLLEKIGFKKEAHFKDRVYFNNQFSDMAVYSLIKGNEIYVL